MTIKVKHGSRCGQVITGAQWFGFAHWIRAWVNEPDGNGWLHWHASELEILSNRD